MPAVSFADGDDSTAAAAAGTNTNKGSSSPIKKGFSFGRGIGRLLKPSQKVRPSKGIAQSPSRAQVSPSRVAEAPQDGGHDSNANTAAVAPTFINHASIEVLAPVNVESDAEQQQVNIQVMVPVEVESSVEQEEQAVEQEEQETNTDIEEQEAAAAEDAGMHVEIAPEEASCNEVANSTEMTEEELIEVAEAEEEQAIKEMRRNKIEAEERATREEEIARQKAGEEEAAKALAAEEAARRAKLAAMSEDELLSLQLSSKLSEDHQNAEMSMGEAEQALRETEASIECVNNEMAMLREREAKAITSLLEQVDAYDSVMSSAVERYDTETASFAGEVNELIDLETQRRASNTSIASRGRVEVSESEKRLGKQKALMNKLQLELQKLSTAQVAAEAQADEELATITSVAASKELKYNLAKTHLDLLKSTQGGLAEQYARDNTELLEAKRDRLASTKAQLEEMKGRIQCDEKATAAFRAREAELAEEGKASKAAAASRMRSLEIDRDCISSLTALQNVSLDLYNPGEVASVTEAELLTNARQMILSHRSASEQQALEIRKRGEYEVELATADEKERQSTLRQVSAERKAVEVRLGELRRFLLDKTLQHEYEEKALWENACELRTETAKIEMLDLEVERFQELLSERAAEVAKAKSERQAALDRLAAMRAQHEAVLAAARVRFESEKRVAAEQQQYTDSLCARLEVEARADGNTNVSTPPEATSNLGTAAIALINHASVESKAMIDNLRSERAEVAARLVGTKKALEAAEKKANLDVRRLKERRVAQQHELDKLSQFTASVAARLHISVSPSAPTKPLSSPYAKKLLWTDKMTPLDPDSPVAVEDLPAPSDEGSSIRKRIADLIY